MPRESAPRFWLKSGTLGVHSQAHPYQLFDPFCQVEEVMRRLLVNLGDLQKFKDFDAAFPVSVRSSHLDRKRVSNRCPLIFKWTPVE